MGTSYYRGINVDIAINLSHLELICYALRLDSAEIPHLLYLVNSYTTLSFVQAIYVLSTGISLISNRLQYLGSE